VDALRLDIDVPLRRFRLELGLTVGQETVALVGPSGAGKSSVLRAVAGLLRPERGRIALGDEAWFDSDLGLDRPPEERGVGMVFQDYKLFPHMTVRANVAFGGRERADELLDRLGLRHLADVRPDRISGGERQRVALARALARNPSVLLLDEPLAALDAHTRDTVRAELAARLANLGLPTVLVTHDYDDAAALAGRIGVLVDGRLRQMGTPAELVAAPADAFVARFAGGTLIHGQAEPAPSGLTRVRLDEGGVVLSTDEAHGPVGVVVYPWDVSVAREAPDDSAQNHLAGEIGSLVPVANRVRVRIGPVVAEVTAASAERLGLAPGQRAVASFKASGTRLVPLQLTDDPGV
jgi:molybdate transport system ATP-binding protein